MSADPLPFPALILVGGLGTRLRPMVSDCPKPMAPVCGKPFLEILLDLLIRKGVSEFVLLTGYLGEQVENHFREGYRGTAGIRFSREPEPLGTGGAVRHARDKAGDPSLIVYGDTYFDVDLHELYRFHRHSQGIASLSLRHVPDAGRYGRVVTREDGRIEAFEEKGTGGSGPGLVAGGFYLYSRAFFDVLPDETSFSMEREVFPDLAREGLLYGLPQDKAFFDIGTPESYESFIDFAAGALIDHGNSS